MSKQLDQLAFSFFKLFAQYESNLKEKGFFQANGKKINVDWDRFANEVIGNSFLEDLGDKAQYAEFILSEPPKRQVANEDNQIIWQDVANNDKSVQSLFGHITRVRNNLYHGAKFNGTWFDPQRSKDLIEASVIILRHYEDCIRN
tara:strand:+ start:2507 stop:2941 length:435 start_codon:yes stop_codon:yes gene_type:complete